MRSAIALIAAAVLALGCGRAPLAPTDGDIVPQHTVGVADVVDGWDRAGDVFVSPILAAPTGATRVAFIGRVDVDADVALFARAKGDDAWLPATVTWRDDVAGNNDRFVARVDLAAVATAVEVGVAAADVARLRSLTYEAIVPMPATAASSTSPVTQAPSTTTAAVLDGYQPRSAWGARAASGCDSNNTKTKVTVHHTVSRLNAGGTANQFSAEIRSAQALHMDGRGYCDIGYHFLVTADGTVWEGRNQNNLGAHTGGQNTNNLGVSFVGCFHPTSDCNGLGATTPPQAMLDGAGAFIGTAARHYGITLTVGSTLMGHRDNPGQSTACPGDNLHARLADLRTIANNGGGNATPAKGKVQGMVWNLGVTPNIADADTLGAMLPGAVVTAQQGTTAVATSTARDGDAYWSFDLDPGSYTLVVTMDGFAQSTRDVTVAAGDDRWASIGITPTVDAVDVAIAVVDAVTAAPLAGAVVEIGGQEPQTADADGRLALSLPPGPLSITARAEGYEPHTEFVTAVLGTPLSVSVALDAVVVEEPGEGEGEPGIGDDVEGDVDVDGGLDRIVIRNNSAPKVNAGTGCGGCTQTSTTTSALAVFALALLRRRRC
jgi:hypothetical protein